MQISMTTEYAIRALLYLAGEGRDEVKRIADIAPAAEVPENYLRKIIPILTKAGFVRSTVGVTGGIQLAVDPADITLLDVFETVEGRMFLNKCLIHPSVCHRTPFCAVHVVWVGIQEQMKQRLREQSLAELARMNGQNLSRYMEETGDDGRAVK
jgi:Rrf2 family transcriptional regulator, iron-sulfur cluster assembly transcription factor